MMRSEKANSRLEAATTGRQDACPTPDTQRHLTAGFHSRDKLIDLHGQCAETRDVRFVIPHRREAESTAA